MPITIRDLALHRGALEVNGGINGAEFHRVGLNILGGCAGCGATLAAYNAYPTKSGYWRCADCVYERADGYETVEEANEEMFGHHAGDSAREAAHRRYEEEQTDS